MGELLTEVLLSLLCFYVSRTQQQHPLFSYSYQPSECSHVHFPEQKYWAAHKRVSLGEYKVFLIKWCGAQESNTIRKMYLYGVFWWPFIVDLNGRVVLNTVGKSLSLTECSDDGGRDKQLWQHFSPRVFSRLYQPLPQRRSSPSVWKCSISLICLQRTVCRSIDGLVRPAAVGTKCG